MTAAANGIDHRLKRARLGSASGEIEDRPVKPGMDVSSVASKKDCECREQVATSERIDDPARKSGGPKSGHEGNGFGQPSLTVLLEEKPERPAMTLDEPGIHLRRHRAGLSASSDSEDRARVVCVVFSRRLSDG